MLQNSNLHIFTMARQFLIPWILIIPQILCQPPQPPGFDRADPFQHLFTHPTIAPQHPFGLNGFSPLYNTHVIHPHYDLLSAGGTNVMNPNFIHPHPFFPLHQFPATIPIIKTTIATPSSTNLQTTTTLKPQTTALSITTTIQSESTTQKIENSTIHVPQAAKPIVESVKTYSLENEKEQMEILSSLEKMDNSAAKIQEVQKTQKFPTPSSTVLPTAQHITNQTTQSPSTTIEISTLPPTTTTVQPTTNLPKKISAEAEKAALNGEKLDLIRHLNTSDLESFLRSANLSTNEAQNFLRLVEKVLEEELQKRLHKESEKVESVKSEIHSSEASSPTISTSISSIKQPTDSKLLNSDVHDVKTVNTRLNYESSEIDQSTNTGIMPNLTSSSQNPPRIVAYSQRSALEINSADKSRANPSFNSLDEVRQREQQEFDKLLGQIVLKTDSSETNNKGEEEEPVNQNEDDDLLPPGSQNTNPPIQLPPRNNFNRPAIRHPPKTNFDKLAQDYQYRLSNSNGLNDLIKALRNAHIGFFDRTKKNRPKIRID